MKPVFNHSLISSFALYLDNQLLDGGLAYVNHSGSLYPQLTSSVSGNVWAAPYKEWVADSCISGANVCSGAYTSSGQFLTRQSGVVVDFINGRVISPNKWGNLTASYARKEYNIYTSTEDEINWWMENVYAENKNITYTATGMMDGRFAAPCIVLTNSSENNEPWALGGLEDTKQTIRGYIISSTRSPFAQEGVNSLCRDLAHGSFSLISYADVPYTSSGDLKGATTGASYCYSDLCARYGSAGVYIENVHEVRVSQRANKSSSFSVAVSEFDLSTIRTPRTSK